MRATEAAEWLGIGLSTLQAAATRGDVESTRSSNGARNFSPDQLRAYAKQRNLKLPEHAQARACRQTKREPGQPTRAEELAGIVLQMADLAASAETLAEDMLPAQIEYAFRLIWDRLDPERRAMIAAFVDVQRAKPKP